MADTDTVTWIELKDHCKASQGTCRDLMAAQNETHALRIETERRSGMGELQATVDKLAIEVGSIKELLDSKSVMVLPKPVLYLLCIAMFGAGAAGEKILAILTKLMGIG